MADLLEIDVSALSADANTLDSLLSSGKAELAAMKESIAALRSTWTGAAHGTAAENSNVGHLYTAGRGNGKH